GRPERLRREPSDCAEHQPGRFGQSGRSRREPSHRVERPELSTTRCGNSRGTEVNWSPAPCAGLRLFYVVNELFGNVYHRVRDYGIVGLSAASAVTRLFPRCVAKTDVSQIRIPPGYH